MFQGTVPRRSAQRSEGLQHRRNAGILAVTGFLLAGPVFGVLAIWQAGKASSLSVRSTGWMVLGVVDIIAGILVASTIL